MNTECAGHLPEWQIWDLKLASVGQVHWEVFSYFFFVSAQSWLTPYSECNINLTRGAPSLGITAAPRSKYSSTANPEKFHIQASKLEMKAGSCTSGGSHSWDVHNRSSVHCCKKGTEWYLWIFQKQDSRQEPQDCCWLLTDTVSNSVFPPSKKTFS